MADIRKIITFRETILTEMGQRLEDKITRAAGLAVVRNPLAGRFEQDLTPLFEIGREIGDLLSAQIVELLDRPAVTYGKAALVGLNGEMEHGGACIHPMLGKPMRTAVGGGKAVISSNVKIASAGTALDMPLGHKDEAWSFDHFDTMTMCVADAPRLDEIVVMLAFADGGRPVPRCGSGPI
ncbi:MAG: amino acid synthesis family protein [Anderseniella sp.]|nr:amino acid synthesis family protein [Anderseniella sp.]